MDVGEKNEVVDEKEGDVGKGRRRGGGMKKCHMLWGRGSGKWKGK